MGDTPAPPRHRRSVPQIILIVVLVLLGVGGLQGGITFLRDPSGKLMGAPLSWLEHTPIDDYTLPGIWLLLGIGIAPLVAAVAMWRRAPWAWILSLLIGIALMAWIGVEIVLVPQIRGEAIGQILWSVFGGLGIVITALSLLPSVRRSPAA